MVGLVLDTLDSSENLERDLGQLAHKFLESLMDEECCRSVG